MESLKGTECNGFPHRKVGDFNGRSPAAGKEQKLFMRQNFAAEKNVKLELRQDLRHIYYKQNLRQNFDIINRSFYFALQDVI